jgi:hypothetical protein
VDSVTRTRATDELITSGPVFAAIPLARWLRNDSAVIDVFERYSRDNGYHDYDDPWFRYALLGPRMAVDTRLQSSFRRLGVPGRAALGGCAAPAPDPDASHHTFNVTLAAPPGALCGEKLGSGPSDAAARSGDERDSTVHVRHREDHGAAAVPGNSFMPSRR